MVDYRSLTSDTYSNEMKMLLRGRILFYLAICELNLNISKNNNRTESDNNIKA